MVPKQNLDRRTNPERKWSRWTKGFSVRGTRFRTLTGLQLLRWFHWFLFLRSVEIIIIIIIIIIIPIIIIIIIMNWV